jgi:hypothetical protein
MTKQYICLFFFFINTLFGQIQTSGLLQLDGTMSFQLDKDWTNSKVILIINGPADRWFSIAFDTELMLANKDCVLMTSDTSFKDCYMPGGHNAPILDLDNNWNLELNTVTNGIRSIKATRDLTTNDVHDFDFSSTSTQLNMIWAYSSTPDYLLFNHGGDNYGGTTISFTTLNVDENTEEHYIKLYPNPANREFIISPLVNEKIISIEVTNELGQLLFKRKSNSGNLEPLVNTEYFDNGMYEVKVESDLRTAISKLIISH